MGNRSRNLSLILGMLLIIPAIALIHYATSRNHPVSYEKLSAFEAADICGDRVLPEEVTRHETSGTAHLFRCQDGREITAYQSVSR